MSGSAQAIVYATGGNTWFGQLAGRVSEQESEPNAFQKGISRVSMLLIRFMLVMAPVVLLINGYTKGDWWEAALFALSVAVGLTPEMLPMIVTSTLARGAVKLSKQKVIVKHLDAIQNFGAMDILCTDKTGTLTQDKIVLENHTDVSGKSSERVLHTAWLNSHYQTGLKNLLDTAVLEGVELDAARGLAERWQKVDEIPFDFERRRMSVVVKEQDDAHQLICKGALQEILNVSTQVRYNGEIVPLDDTMLRRIRRVTDTLNRQGLRVVAVATKYLPAREGDYQRADESDLILEGYIAFLDPPKETTAPALKALKASGITVKILTGDSELVAAKVCHEVGLDAGEVVIGSQIEAMSDDELAALAKRTTLFARLAPLHKERIVTLLKREGQWWALWATVLTTPRRYVRRILAFPLTGRWISPARRRISFCWKKPDGTGGGGYRRPPHLRQHAQVHQNDRQLQLRQCLQRAGGQRLPAVSADAAAAPVDSEPAV